MLLRLLTVCCLFFQPVCAETVFAAQTLRPKTVIAAGDVYLKNIESPGGARTLQEVIGKEVRNAIYAHRPIRPSDIAEPALVERNQVVVAVFSRQGLAILAEVRALQRGAEGDRIRVMNLSSRATTIGVVQADGRIKAGP